jgi:hypothetical protein
MNDLMRAYPGMNKIGTVVVGTVIRSRGFKGAIPASRPRPTVRVGRQRGRVEVVEWLFAKSTCAIKIYRPARSGGGNGATSSQPFAHVLQPSSASRFMAGAAGFLTLIQSLERPERYSEPRRLDTIPSQPSLQAWWKTIDGRSSILSAALRSSRVDPAGPGR